MSYKDFKPLRITGLLAGIAVLGALGLTALPEEPTLGRHDGFGIGSSMAHAVVVHAGAEFIRELGIGASMLWADW